jgi:hypothetical protein
MNEQPDYLARFGPVQTRAIRQPYTLLLSVCLLALLSACSANRSGTDVGIKQRLRLMVGDIKEVSVATRPDTTWQLTATSDNQEVVDVSRKLATPTTGSEPKTAESGSAMFLVKGVTVGTANVIISEKQVGTNGDGRVRKSYVVTVSSK